ncbi:MAG: hypothetical protein ACJ79H_10015 [Myxococcales bacterium]
MDKSTTWILVAVVVAFLLLSSGSKSTTRPRYGYPPGNGGAYPVPGPSPMGTSWAQQGPYPPATAQTNAWDVAQGVIGLIPGIVGAYNASGGGSSGGGEYTVPYEENGLDFTT